MARLEDADPPHMDGANDSPPLVVNQIPPLSSSWDATPLTDAKKHKIHQILQACSEHDLVKLKLVTTTEGGLIEDAIRRTAWPILLGIDKERIETDGSEWKSLPQHQDEDQVRLDVDRSFVHYPEGQDEKARDTRKLELSNLITATLRKHPILNYFQGYHDIAQVILLVLGAREATPAIARLSLLRIRDFMLPTMAGTEPHLKLLPTILYAADPQLYKHLSQTQPFFALAATLTLYAHDVEDYGDIARLFDFLLAGEAVIPVYFFAVVVMSRKSELLEIDADEPDMLHSVLSKLPKPLDLDGLISRTSELFSTYPPERLPRRFWSSISANSVLKTTRDLLQLSNQTLDDGERFFVAQALEIRRADAWHLRQVNLRRIAIRYRRPTAYVSVAFAIALLAVALRSSDARYALSRLSPFLIGAQVKMTAWLQRLAPY